MRIWHSYGSEHSMNLIVIGTFQSVPAAKAAAKRMAALKALAEQEWSDDDWRRTDVWMSDATMATLRELELYDMGRVDVEMFAFEHTVKQRETSVRITTDESEVQGFLKVLLSLGGRVEVFSGDEWNDDGSSRIDELADDDGVDDSASSPGD